MLKTTISRNFAPGTIIYTRQGFGLYVYEDKAFVKGARYLGQWHLNKRHGQGMLTSVTPYLNYTGHWKDNKLHGYGVLRNGSVYYKGHWNNGRKHGLGTLISSHPNFTYTGSFERGRYEGHGVFSHSDMSYNGSFSNGQFDGFGIKKNLTENTIYKGFFKDGHCHGNGTFYSTVNNFYYSGGYSRETRKVLAHGDAGIRFTEVHLRTVAFMDLAL